MHQQLVINSSLLSQGPSEASSSDGIGQCGASSSDRGHCMTSSSGSGNRCRGGSAVGSASSTDCDPIALLRLRSQAVLLRFRVTQVVCGLVVMVLGAVACIEEGGKFQVGTGVLAGTVTVIAAVASIWAAFGDKSNHSRWIHGVTTSSLAEAAIAEWRVAALLSALWTTAVSANLVTLAFAVKAVAETRSLPHPPDGILDSDGTTSSINADRTTNLAIIGVLEAIFILVIFTCGYLHLRLVARYRYFGFDIKK